MKTRETRSLMATGCFVAVLLAFTGAGLAPAGAGEDPVARTEPDRYVPDAQFAQYLEYRARLDTSTDCQ